MAIFDSKNFNGNVFKQYVDRVPNLNRNELIKSRAIKKRQDIADSMSDQVGGNYVTIPLRGIISGAVPQNYDGSTNITSNPTKTFSHSRVVVGRAQAWTERDFSYDITGGEDTLADVASQIGEYWEEVDQATIIKILTGIFAMKDAEGVKFVREHTYDVTGKTNSEGALGLMDGTSLNTAMQRACGDNKGAFSLAIMHSAVATGLENLKLLAYMKYTDKDGIERDLKRVYEIFPRLEERKNQIAGTLSGGEQQMLAMGRGIMSAPDLIMLDEPSLGLAPLLVNTIFDTIREIKAMGKTILLVEQNALKALSVADNAYVLEQGRITKSGPGKELLKDPAIAEAYLGKAAR